MEQELQLRQMQMQRFFSRVPLSALGTASTARATIFHHCMAYKSREKLHGRNLLPITFSQRSALKSFGGCGRKRVMQSYLLDITKRQNWNHVKRRCAMGHFPPPAFC